MIKTVQSSQKGEQGQALYQSGGGGGYFIPIWKEEETKENGNFSRLELILHTHTQNKYTHPQGLAYFSYCLLVSVFKVNQNIILNLKTKFPTPYPSLAHLIKRNQQGLHSLFF